MSIRLNHVFVTLASERFDHLVAYYQALLGQSPEPLLPNRYAEFQLPGLRLGIFKPKATHCEEFAGAGGGMSLCLEVESLEGAIATLTDLGYPPPGEVTQASHGREIYAYDPDGNRLILHQAHIQKSL
ncbi:MAG: VOC family protein [Cyanobacteria bacterium P01_A01_bin.114]